jgi:hypothetical protein
MQASFRLRSLLINELRALTVLRMSKVAARPVASTIGREFSHILTSMCARLMAVTLTLVITGAPVVTAACEAACASRETGGATTGEHHSCHHEPSAPASSAITSATHDCGHSDEGPNAVGQSQWSPIAAPAIVTGAFALSPETTAALLIHTAGGDHSPPSAVPLSRQLRI